MCRERSKRVSNTCPKPVSCPCAPAQLQYNHLQCKRNSHYITTQRLLGYTSNHRHKRPSEPQHVLLSNTDSGNAHVLLASTVAALGNPQPSSTPTVRLQGILKALTAFQTTMPLAWVDTHGGTAGNHPVSAHSTLTSGEHTCRCNLLRNAVAPAHLNLQS